MGYWPKEVKMVGDWPSSFFFCMFMDQDEDDLDEILYLHSLSDVVLLLVVFFENVCRSVEGGSYDLSNLYPSFF